MAQGLQDGATMVQPEGGFHPSLFCCTTWCTWQQCAVGLALPAGQSVLKGQGAHKAVAAARLSCVHEGVVCVHEGAANLHITTELDARVLHQLTLMVKSLKCLPT